MYIFYSLKNTVMKTINTLRVAIVSAVLLLMGFNSILAQNKKHDKQAAVKNMVELQQYILKAQFVSPMTGHQRALTSDYDLTVSKSAVNSYLPFFGRPSSAPIDPSQ